MGSRRTMERSLSNGRSSNGNNVSGSSRLGGCSYLSNVRRENRSTLCSVMAQLTEETQPSFQTTLKSKAVSENCNVKFSCVVTGYPTPQVIWYKDDIQLDRFCGLPKYEIFRNGQNHSLHIYNCTMEDAAIYQASASNTKGIVSCSGVLEVGEMNEFKIHQRYFAKLKQKAENKHREAEGKENQEPIRTISPDRSQRKRRSAMEAFLSAPNSVEDEGNEENHHAVAVESEERLQEPMLEQLEEIPAPMSNGAVSAVTSGPVANENGNKGGTYIFDSVQKIFTALQPKTPFVKKKIKMSNGSKVSKADIPGEKVSKEEAPTSVAPACKESLQGNSDMVIEVESAVSSPNSSPESRNYAEHQQKSVHKIAKDENPDIATAQKEQRPAHLGAHTSTPRASSGSEGRHAAKSDQASESKENLEKQIQRHHMTLVEPQQSAEEPKQHLTGDITKTEDLTPMDIDEKSNTDVTLSDMCENRTALPQRPCKQTGDHLLEKETSPCQKNAAVSRPALLSEVTPATEMSRNDAPVNLGLPPDQCLLDAQPPQKTVFEGEATTDVTQTTAVHRSLQASTVKITQETRDHSRGSNESHTALFTDLQKSPLKSPSGVEKTQGCNVSPREQPSQVDTAIKSVEGTEIQVDEKVAGNDEGKLSVQADSVAPKERSVRVATETTVAKKMEQTQKTRDRRDTDGPVNTTKTEMPKNERVINMKEDPRLELQKETPTKMESNTLHRRNPPENINSADQQMVSFQEVSKPVTKIISIAELLRSQIRALDSTVENSLPTMAISNSVECPIFMSADNQQELRHEDRKYTLDVRKTSPDIKTEASIDDKPIKNIKETLMEIYDDLNKTNQENIQTPAAISPHVQTSEKPLMIPPISVTDTGAATGCDSTAKKRHEGVMDVGEKNGTLAPLKAENENFQNCFAPVTSNERLNKRFLMPQKNLSDSKEVEVLPTVSRVKAGSPESILLVSEHATKEVQGKAMGFVGKPTPEINPHAKPQGVNPEEVSNQCKREEYSTTTSCLQGAPKIPMKIVLSPDTQESSMAGEFSRSHSLTNPNSEASPLSKRRNCVSPIPSATPQELASGARRKILVPKASPEEVVEAPSPIDTLNQKKELSTQSRTLSPSPATSPTSPSLLRRSPLLQPTDERTSPVEKRSPLLSRRRMTAESSTPNQQPGDDIQGQKPEEKPAEKDKLDPRKAPQVIRKIRGETFADASGHLKLWCQFFNILSDSTIRWYRNQVEIAHMKRKAADESQVSLAIVQVSSKDSGAYRCTITNEYGSDSTDFQLNADLLAGLCLREDIGVGEEIEMMPLVFNKGVADSGIWGNKFFGRVMMEKSRIGEGCGHKVWRAKVIYGLEPVFESGNTCIIKARNPIAYGGKEESCLIDRNLDFVRQECKIQNLAREYCKIFSAEARVVENFGPTLEIIPVYLMFRPANTVPYATVEVDLSGVYRKYAALDGSGRMDVRTGSDVEQKCCSLQHWIFQWTNGNLLLSKMEGVDTKITNVGISAKSTGHQGLPVEGNPKVFEQFVSEHQCNYFCGLLGLRSLKVLDSLMAPAKPKGSKSPLLQRKMAAGSSSPQTTRKATGSPRVPRKTEQEGSKTSNKIPPK